MLCELWEQTIHNLSFKALEDASDISCRGRGRGKVLVCVSLKKIGRIFHLELIKHPTPNHPGIMKIYPSGICFCSIRKSLCGLGQVSDHLDFSFQRDGLQQALPAEDAGTLPALLRSDFTDESIAIAVRSCLSFSFVGSMKRILQKMTVVFGSMDLIFGKTKQEIVSSKTKESYSAVFHLRFIRSISMRNMGNLVRNI